MAGSGELVKSDKWFEIKDLKKKDVKRSGSRSTQQRKTRM